MLSTSMIIAKKEIRTNLKGPGFYIILFLFTLLISFVSYQTVVMLKIKSQMPAIPGAEEGVNLHSGFVAQLIYLIHFMLLLFVPAMTSFSFAEERKTRTMDLLLTSPITSFDIVMGKLKASLFLVLSLLGISLLYPLSLSISASLDWSLLISSYVGLFLVAAVYVAIGLFSSSISTSVIVSYVIAVVLNLFCIFIVWSSQTSENPIVRDVVNHISISKHLTDFIQGAVQVSGIVFLFSMIVFFVFLTQRVIESARWR
jgi:ABC-2 type transport system permease protein